MEQENKLYFGDNLDVLRRYIKNESVDLIYLDPPFNSQASYNVLFKAPDDSDKYTSQIQAFDDTWHWGDDDELALAEISRTRHTKLINLLNALLGFLGRNDMMAYLTMMSIRLIELHRVLKPTGNIFLHCDPTASHYLKLILDAIFEHKNFKNEIIWQRTTAGKSVSRNLPRNSDTIFWYSKTSKHFFNPVLIPLTDTDKDTFKNKDAHGNFNTQPIISPTYRENLRYTYIDLNGKEWLPPTNGWRFNCDRMRTLEIENRLVFGKKTIREKYYLDERAAKGKQVSNIWTDIPIVDQGDRLGYATQKPVPLLERILVAASKEGDVVLDPFCGCGTAIEAAHRLKRYWIGIDVTHLSIQKIEERIEKSCKGAKYSVIGRPKDEAGAAELARIDKYQFQWWALTLIGAQPYEGEKKGSDGGIDGVLYFLDREDKRYDKAIVSVKGGKHVGPSMVRDLAGTMDRSDVDAALGFFITLVPPTQDMKTMAAAKGVYHSNLFHKDYPKLQILTIQGLMNGSEQPVYPNIAAREFFNPYSQKSATDDPPQGSLDL